MTYQRLKSGINEVINEIKKGEEDIEGFHKDIERCQNIIAKEQQRIDEINGGSKEKLNDSLSELKAKLEDLAQERERVRSELNEAGNYNDSELLDCEKS